MVFSGCMKSSPSDEDSRKLPARSWLKNPAGKPGFLWAVFFSIHHPTKFRYATPAMRVADAYPGRVGGMKDRRRMSHFLESATSAFRVQVMSQLNGRAITFEVKRKISLAHGAPGAVLDGIPADSLVSHDWPFASMIVPMSWPCSALIRSDQGKSGQTSLLEKMPPVAVSMRTATFGDTECLPRTQPDTVV